MDKAKILVIEYNSVTAENVCHVLNNLGYQVLEPVLDYNKTIEFLENNSPDIVVLNSENTSVDLIKTIQEKYNLPLIFIAQNLDNLNRVKLFNPSAFLIEPFTKEKLFPAIELALVNSLKQQELAEKNKTLNKAIFFKAKKTYKKLFFEDILFVKSDHVYVEVFLKDETVQTIRISLSDFLKKSPSHFIRIHRGYIVNTNKIEKTNTDSVVINNNIIPLGKSYKKAFFKQFI